ncbi:MAG: carboxymuconolactone decarboxylase family protein [Pseudomonadota bacterium]|jgi:4-carboxymuconolactone decarboxylase|nr:carboxymuconolactone decarboxylase family protein [Pseudomonadota bacterium]
MPRISQLNPDDMNVAQRAVYDDILSGPRTSLSGPFHAWLHSPELASRAQHLGAYCRFSTSLSGALSELAILVVARHWRAQFEWYAHAPMALKAGIEEEVVEAIRGGTIPVLSDPRQAVVYDFVSTLLQERTVNQDLYDQAVAGLGELGVVDLVGIVGYYCLVSATLNVFDMPLPEGESPPLDP